MSGWYRSFTQPLSLRVGLEGGARRGSGWATPLPRSCARATRSSASRARRRARPPARWWRRGSASGPWSRRWGGCSTPASSIAWLPKIPILSEGILLLHSAGAYEGDYIYGFVRDKLERLGVRTFGDRRRRRPQPGARAAQLARRHRDRRHAGAAAAPARGLRTAGPRSRRTARDGDRRRDDRGRALPADLGLGRVSRRVPAAAGAVAAVSGQRSRRLRTATSPGASASLTRSRAIRPPVGAKPGQLPSAATARPSMRTCGASSVRPAPVGS